MFTSGAGEVAQHAALDGTHECYVDQHAQIQEFDTDIVMQHAQHKVCRICCIDVAVQRASHYTSNDDVMVPRFEKLLIPNLM